MARRSARNTSWNAYMEPLPDNTLDRYGPVVDRAQAKLYAKNHHPLELLDSVKNNPDRMTKVKDYSAQATDLTSKTAPKFVGNPANE